MFEGLKDFIELGGTVVVVLAFLCYLYLEQKKKSNGPAQVITENHLPHLQKALDEGNEWHRKTYEILCEIKGKLGK